MNEWPRQPLRNGRGRPFHPPWAAIQQASRLYCGNVKLRNTINYRIPTPVAYEAARTSRSRGMNLPQSISMATSTTITNRKTGTLRETGSLKLKYRALSRALNQQPRFTKRLLQDPGKESPRNGYDPQPSIQSAPYHTHLICKDSESPA